MSEAHPVSVRRRSWVVLLILFGSSLLFSRCTCDPESVNRGDVNLISYDKEWQMGEQMAAELKGQLTLSDDPVVRRYIEQMGQAIVQETELADREWHFYVVQDPAVNAFALPGGHIYIHTGLIEAAESAGELASVVAHEVGHVVARHSTERLTTLYGLDFMASLVLGGDSGFIERALAQLVGAGATAKFSRDDEREADLLGQEYMVESGYAPEAMVAMFETLLAEQERQPTMIERFFATHPMTDERVESARSRLEALPEVTGAPPELAADFPRVRARVKEQAGTY